MRAITSVAAELGVPADVARSREEERAIAISDDRGRIGVVLCETAIRQLFAAGLQLESIASDTTPQSVARRRLLADFLPRKFS